MTQQTVPNLIAALELIGAMITIGILAWIFVPVLFPDTTRRLKAWFKNTAFPSTDPVSYGDASEEEVWPVDPWRAPPEDEKDLLARESDMFERNKPR